MKRRLLLLAVGALVLTLSLTVVTLASYSGSLGNLHYEITDDGEVTITAYYGNEKDVVIPETIEGYPVTAISDTAFIYNEAMESLTLPESMQCISSSFYECNNFKKFYISSLSTWLKIDFPNGSPLSNGVDLYVNGELLTDLIIPESITEIKPSAFFGYQRLNSVTIHSNVTKIGEQAFTYCNNLQSVHIEDLQAWCSIDFGWGGNPLSIADKLYVNGREIQGLMYIPEGTVKINERAFWDFKGVQTVYIPDSVTEIGAMSFTGCTNLHTVDVTPLNSAYSSFDGVLFTKDKTQLVHYPAGKTDTTYTIPASVTTICAGSIRKCQYLKHVIIGDNVTSIGITTLCECDFLESVTLGKNIETIPTYVFSSCPSLTKINVTDLAAWCEMDIQTDYGVFHFGADLYLNGELLEKLIVPESVTELHYGPFAYCDKITDVVLHKGITSIAPSAFWRCTGITNVWYTGSEQDRANMQIDASNDVLLNATWSYNSCSAGGDHTYDHACDTECNVCAARRTTEHNYQWVVDRTATADVPGIQHEECTVCHARRNENTEIPEILLPVPEPTETDPPATQPDTRPSVSGTEATVPGQSGNDNDPTPPDLTWIWIPIAVFMVTGITVVIIVVRKKKRSQ